MFRSYQIFLVLTKLDTFFFIVFSIQFLILVLKYRDPEFAVTVAALPITVIALALAVKAVMLHRFRSIISYLNCENC